jgi:RNA polymerase sigma factor (sigma-70 family)
MFPRPLSPFPFPFRLPFDVPFFGYCVSMSHEMEMQRDPREHRMKQEVSIRDWVVRAQGGDQEAFRMLVERFHPILFGIAYSIVGDKTASEDLAQDAMVACWEHLSALRAPEAFPVWVRKTVRNLAFNWLRSSIYRKKLSERAAFFSNQDASVAETPAAVMTRTEGQERLGKILQTISPRLREALVLYYLEGKSIPEAALALDITQHSMKQRLKRGRAQLRETLQSR